jgi:hypothetical protein
MESEKEKKILPFIEAYTKGKVIQCYDKINDKWNDCALDLKQLINANVCFLRIKPDIRTFRNQDECWNEMLKHSPFGWVKNRGALIKYYSIKSVTSSGVEFADIDNRYSFYKMLNLYEFADGALFGYQE